MLMHFDGRVKLPLQSCTLCPPMHGDAEASLCWMLCRHAKATLVSGCATPAASSRPTVERIRSHALMC